jgi:predicted TIM-barrel fold metal-dependent hydrolase
MAAVDPAVVPEIPPIISVDDHVVEPKDLWERWLPERFKSLGPRVVRAPYELKPLNERQPGETIKLATSGPQGDFWIYEGEPSWIHSSFAAAGRANTENDERPVGYEQMRPGFYSLKERLEDMDVNGIERSLCFPTIPRFCGQLFHEAKDKEVALECVRAYNNWMVEEWAGDSGGRLIPLTLIPLWDPIEAAREVRRNAARGARAVSFCELPAQLGLPSIHDRDGYWEPFFAACAETATVICMHIGSSSRFFSTSDDAPGVVRAALTAVNSQMSLADWLLSGVLARHPGLRLAYSEGQVGWIPFILERCDTLWERKTATHRVPASLTEAPSAYFHRQVYGCFFEDDFGLKARNDIGIDVITFESDYPHQDTTWPNTRAYAESAMADLSAQEIEKITRTNAIKLFGLEPTLSI